MASKSICIVDGCDKAAVGRRMCDTHYRRVLYWERKGEEQPKGPRRSKLIEFLDRALEQAGDACIIWPYGVSSNGYGALIVDGKSVSAHRFQCMRAHGEPPSPDHHAAHWCGNKLCVNPTHIRWATPQENSDDVAIHGHRQYGSASHRAKLNETQVAEIKRAIGQGIHVTVLAERYSVATATIIRIKDGTGWTHVTQDATPERKII